MSNIIESVILAETISEYFDETIGGVASDFAYYELLTLAEDYLNDALPKKRFLRHLEFIYGFDESDFLKTTGEAKRKWKEVNKELFGADDAVTDMPTQDPEAK